MFAYDFEWDPDKARTNALKHGIAFERAAEVFRDPLAISIPDEEHSLQENRWVTLGKDTHQQFVVVVHTFEQQDEGAARIRIISARRPTAAEIRHYEEDQ